MSIMVKIDKKTFLKMNEKTSNNKLEFQQVQTQKQQILKKKNH